MLVVDAEEQQVQAWLERRLASLSDADAPTLAEYCVALLKHEQPPEEVYKMCIEQLSDFLGSSTQLFVDEVFEALQKRAFARSSLPFVPSGRAVPTSTDPAAAVGPEPGLHVPTEVLRDPVFQRFVSEQQQRDQITTGGTIDIPGNRADPVKRRKPCFEYQRSGSCRRGEACHFEHTLNTNKPAAGDAPSRVRHRDDSHRLRGPQHDRSKSTLVVEQVPQDKFTTEHITEFFSRFGGVQEVNLIPQYQRAIIRFVDWDAASRAYTSPTPVFDNRFVKVFWLREDHHTSAGDPKIQEVQVDLDLDPQAIAKRQQDHLERTARQQQLKTKMEQLKSAQRALAAKQAHFAQAVPSMLPDASSSEAGASGPHIAALEAQLEALKAKAQSLGVENLHDPARLHAASERGRWRGRGNSVRGAARGGARSSPYAGRPMRLDNRPRKVVVEQFPADKVEALERYVQQLDYEAIEQHEGKPAIVFKTREAAERFAVLRNIQEIGTVQMRFAPHGST
ncbi:hypothetical protein PYCC9005_004224 [Savitreella phatthalungensis]